MSLQEDHQLGQGFSGYSSQTSSFRITWERVKMQIFKQHLYLLSQKIWGSYLAICIIMGLLGDFDSLELVTEVIILTSQVKKFRCRLGGDLGVWIKTKVCSPPVSTASVILPGALVWTWMFAYPASIHVFIPIRKMVQWKDPLSLYGSRGNSFFS